ncbi:MAG: L-threonylcarbamoyladenylate synthase [Flavobacteriaceae bacterium]|nr:L-threonylcarbamoyladenylate synthase [Flavobacteriaceae bacterium]
MVSIHSEVEKALAIIKKGGTLIYPTDTVWGLGCDATNQEAVKKIYNIKQREESKSTDHPCVVLCYVKKYIPVLPEQLMTVLSEMDRPTTVIYKNPMGLADNVVAQDQTVGIRLISEPFCSALIEAFGKPIVSTSANVSGEQSPACFADIPVSLLNKADYVVNLHRDKKEHRASAIIRWNEKGDLEYLRK